MFFRKFLLPVVSIFIICATILTTIPLFLPETGINLLLILTQSIFISLGAVITLTIFGFIRQKYPKNQSTHQTPTKAFRKITSIQYQSATIFILLSILPMIVIGFFFNAHLESTFKDETLRNKQESLQWSQLELTNTLYTLQRTLIQSAQSNEVKRLFTKTLTGGRPLSKAEVATQQSQIYNSTYIDLFTIPIIRTDFLKANGSLIFSFDHSNYTFVHQYSFKQTNKTITQRSGTRTPGEIILHQEYTGNNPTLAENTLLLHIATPVIINKKVTGYIVQHLSVYALLSSIATIANEPFIILSDPNRNYYYSQFNSVAPPKLWETFFEWPQQILHNQSSSLQPTDNSTYIFHATTHINLKNQKQKWLISSTINANAHMKKASLFSTVLISFIIGMGCIVFGLSILVAHYWSTPLLQLSGIAEKLKRGDYTVRSTINRSDEIGLLSTTFNNMAEKVEHYTTDLESQVEKRTDQYNHARQKAEAISASKSRFLAHISQEIRTPMNSIVGSSSLLKDTHLDTEHQGYVSIINDSTQVLLNVINDIIDFSRIENNTLEIENIPFQLNTLLELVHAHFKPLADEKGLTFDMHLPDNAPATLIGDATRIKQVLYNLVSNAIKFTHAGNIILATEHTFINEHYIITFTVTDTGIGIPDNKRDTIFFNFTQAEPTTDEQYGGIGLGLSLCKHLTELMGGTLSVKSKEMSGSTFTISLTLKASDTQLSEIPLSATKKNRSYQKTVLLVEDNKINQIVTQKSLVQMGLTVTIAENGQHALDLLHSHSYDLIFMDIQMPIMDGLAATRAIRTQLNLTTPIVAMTALALKENRLKCFEAGMDGFISKPLTQEDIIIELDRWFHTL
ncbi:MAG: response regulator [Fibrobacterales bacterium]